MGVNSPLELSRSEEFLRERVVDGLLRSGVMLHAARWYGSARWPRWSRVRRSRVRARIYGRSVVRRGARIDSHCVMRDTVIEAGRRYAASAISRMPMWARPPWWGPMPVCGPAPCWKKPRMWATSWSSKNPRLGKGAKANHLTYLGDSEIGAGTNIGAGTIACNYDGKHKFKTSIGEGAFIGRDPALVAPGCVWATAR